MKSTVNLLFQVFLKLGFYEIVAIDSVIHVFEISEQTRVNVKF